MSDDNTLAVLPDDALLLWIDASHAALNKAITRAKSDMAIYGAPYPNAENEITRGTDNVNRLNAEYLRRHPETAIIEKE